MAAITITRPLSDQGTGTDRDFISAFMPATFEFTFERGTATNTYAEVSFNGYTFRATMIQANHATNTDLYLMDLTNILPYWLGFAPTSIITSTLFKDLSVLITGRSSAGASLATATHISTRVVYGYGNLKDDNIMAQIYFYGRKSGINYYYNGLYMPFYFNGTTGTYTVNFNGVNYNYTINNGYNILTLHSTHQYLSGTFAVTGWTVAFTAKYVAPTTSETREIAWLDDTGNWTRSFFELLSTNTNVESSNELKIFSKTNYEAYAKSVSISKNRTVQIGLRTVAVNVEHFKQLCQINESFRVIDLSKGIVYSVASAPSSVAECRQNLNFTLTLEREDNVVSY